MDPTPLHTQHPTSLQSTTISVAALQLRRLLTGRDRARSSCWPLWKASTAPSPLQVLLAAAAPGMTTNPDYSPDYGQPSPEVVHEGPHTLVDYGQPSPEDVHEGPYTLVDYEMQARRGWRGGGRGGEAEAVAPRWQSQEEGTGGTAGAGGCSVQRWPALSPASRLWWSVARGQGRPVHLPCKGNCCLTPLLSCPPSLPPLPGCCPPPPLPPQAGQGTPQAPSEGGGRAGPRLGSKLKASTRRLASKLGIGKKHDQQQEQQAAPPTPEQQNLYQQQRHKQEQEKEQYVAAGTTSSSTTRWTGGLPAAADPGAPIMPGTPLSPTPQLASLSSAGSKGTYTPTAGAAGVHGMGAAAAGTPPSTLTTIAGGVAGGGVAGALADTATSPMRLSIASPQGRRQPRAAESPPSSPVTAEGVAAARERVARLRQAIQEQQAAIAAGRGGGVYQEGVQEESALTVS